MTKRRITPHKGGRTARVPEARIRPQTLAAIHATMREQGKSFADLVEEEFSGENKMIKVTVVAINTGATDTGMFDPEDQTVTVDEVKYEVSHVDDKDYVRTVYIEHF